jgi:hypothetical protein
MCSRDFALVKPSTNFNDENLNCFNTIKLAAHLTFDSIYLLQVDKLLKYDFESSNFKKLDLNSSHNFMPIPSM